MNKAYIIISCIEPDPSKPLNYSPIRTAFGPDERFRHTIFTVTSLNLVQDPNSKIYLIDSSENWQKYKDIISYYPNLTFVSVKEELPEAFEACRNNPNKSYAETLTMVAFLTKYREELKSFDYFIKVCGRYFVDSHFDESLFNEANLNKLFFKHPIEFEFNEDWNFQMVDRRAIQQNNKFYWYSSVLFAWGREYHDKMIDIFRVSSVMLNHPATCHYQIETLLYFFTREYEKDIVHTNWVVLGFDGVGATFLRY